MNLDQPIGWLETLFLALAIITPFLLVFGILGALAELAEKLSNHD